MEDSPGISRAPSSSLPALRFVAYSPLGRGFLSGTIRSRADLESGDWRLANPRFTDEALAMNSRLADLVGEIAKELDATAAQVALAWVLTRDASIAAIPGTRKIERLEENWASHQLTLRTEHLARRAVPRAADRRAPRRDGGAR